MGMRYYKKWIDNESRYQYEERVSASSDKSMLEITQEEYEYETAKQWEEYLATLPAEDVTDDVSYEELLEKNSDLEKENAALLFQILTGEEYVDV